MKIKLKEIGIKNLILLLIAGIALLVISVPDLFFGKEKNNLDQSEVQTVQENLNYPTQSVLLSDEEKLKLILEKIDGVGAVEVMLIYETSEEKIILKDGEETVLITTEEKEELPYVLKTKTALVSGAVIVAEGGGNGEIAVNISNAVEALFGVPKHKIIVLPMK